MKNHATSTFWSRYNKLPDRIKQAADRQYERFKENPGHPSLRTRVPQRLKNRPEKFIEVTIAGTYRALAIMREEKDEEVYYWFWIGTHAEFDRKVDQL